MNSKLISIALLALATSLAVTAQAGDVDVEERTEMASDGRLSVAGLAGEIKITGWDRNEIWLKGRVGERVERVDFSVNRGEAVIELVYEDEDAKGNRGDRKRWHDHRRGNGYEVDLEIYVPRSTAIEAETVSADIEVVAITARQTLRTASGDIDTVFESGSVDLNSISGDIEAVGKGDKHSLSVSTVSGDADVLNVNGVVQAAAVSGDLNITGPTIEGAQLKIVSGSLEVDAGLADNAKMQMESVSGDIRLRLEEPVSARFDMQTFSGDIDDFYGNSAERASRYAPGKRLRFTQGGGDATVHINTMSGDIEAGE